MQLSVVKMFDRTGDISDFSEIDLSEVKYIDLWQPTENSAKILAYHTSHGSHLALNTLKDVTLAYAQYGFESFDRSTVINRDHIQRIEPYKDGSRVIFNDNTYIYVRKKFKTF